MHPFLKYLRTTYAGSPDMVVEEASAVMVAMRNSDPREKITVFLEIKDDGLLFFDMQAKVRYSIKDARNQLYLQHLEKEITEHNLKLRLLPPRTISLYGTLNHDSVNEAQSWGEACIDLDYFIRIMYQMLQVVTYVTHFNVRVVNRGGTEPYKKALPSRLAALTVCGYLTDASMH